MNAKKKKKTMIAALGVLAPVVLVSGIYYTYLMTPPPMPKTFEKAVNTMDSARYKRLPDYRKAEYAAQARRIFAELAPERQEEVGKEMADDETLRAIGREMRRGEELERYKRFSRASRAERIRMLDEDINRREAARAERQARSRQSGTQRQARSGRQRGTKSATNVIRQMIQQDNPQTGAFGLGAEYRRALKERQKQRGLSEY